MNKRIALVALCLSAMFLLWADDLPPIISHLPLLNTPMYGSPQNVDATIADDTTYNSPIASALLYYSTDNLSFVSLPMTAGAANSYTAAIPGMALGTQIWYYIVATDSAGNPAQSATNTFWYQDPTWRRYVPVSGNYRRYTGVYAPLNVFRNPAYGSGYTLKLTSVEGRLYSAATAHVYVYECASAVPTISNITQVLGPVEVVFPTRTTIVSDISAFGIEIDTPYFCVSYEVPVDIYYAYNPNYFYGVSYAITGSSMANFNGYGTWNIAANVQMGSSLNAPLSEGFEAEMFPPANWSIQNGGDANLWARTTENPHAGVGCALLDAPWPPGPDHDDWLITPRLRPSTENHTFTFWSRRWSDSIFDNFNVKLSTSGSQAADFTVTLAANIRPPVAYQQYSYDLTPYIGQDIYLAVQGISHQGWRLYVDDVGGVPFAPLYTAPNAPSNLLPVEAATGIYLNPQLSWVLNGGGVSGVKLLLDTVNPPVAEFDAGVTDHFTPPGLLLPNTTYYWSVVAYNALGEAPSAVQSFTTGTVPLYPASHALYSEYTDIGQFTIGAYTNPAGPIPELYGNPSANHTYTDFTSLGVIPLNRQNQYPITIAAISSYMSMLYSVATIYIDYNRNGAYDLPQEVFFQADLGTDTNPLSGLSSFIPADAALGFTGMRVVLRENTDDPILPTGTYEYGETEDYAVNIGPAIPPGYVDMTYPANAATGIAATGFDLIWAADPSAGTPTSYTVYLASQPENILSSHSWSTPNTSFNPVLEGGISFNYLDTWYWTVKAVNASGEAIISPPHSFQIMADPTITIPYTAPFTVPDFPAGWSQSSSSGLPSNRWFYWFEGWVCLGASGSGTTRLISPPVNTESTPDLAIQFTGFAYFYDPGIIYKLQYSHDMNTWMDLNWAFPEGPGGYDGTWTAALKDITAPRTYFAWTLEGDQSAMEAVVMLSVSIDAFLPPDPTLQSDGLLAWDAVPLIQSYKVYSADDPAGPYTLESTSPDITWQASLDAGKKFYKVHSNTEQPVPEPSDPPEPYPTTFNEARIRALLQEHRY